MTSPSVLHDTIDVETPELVVLSYQLAGVGSRVYAAIIDLTIQVVLLVIANGFTVAYVANDAGAAGSARAWLLAIMLLVNFGVFWGYFFLFEALWDGQTPGKRLLRLRVVRDGGYAITPGAAAIRNLVRFVDAQPVFFYGVGIGSVMISARGKRLGDYAAGTIVVQEGLVHQPMVAAKVTTTAGADPLALHALLTDAEFALLDRYFARRDELLPERRAALEGQLVQRFQTALATQRGRTDAARLVSLRDAEQQARARGLTSRAETGVARDRHAITSANAPRWSAFAATLATAQKGGLASLGEAGVRDFVSSYRDLSSDLAKLRTATRGADAEDVFYLNRLVASAHNLLYRRRSVPLQQIIRFITFGIPAEIRRAGIPIGMAAVLLFLPAIIAGTAVVQSPKVAEQLVPPGMLERAARGVRRAQTGEGYIQDPQVFRPVMASQIISNNVQVVFGAFSMGIALGAPTAWILVSNGVSLGSVFGLYMSKGIGSLLLAFVAPHGVLELFAICVGGGAGFLLGMAFVIPGARTRRRALVENGKRAITLIAGATLLLLAAGALEGMVSPIPWWPLEGKLAVSGTTAALLYAWIRLGATTTRRAL